MPQHPGPTFLSPSEWRASSQEEWQQGYLLSLRENPIPPTRIGSCLLAPSVQVWVTCPSLQSTGNYSFILSPLYAIIPDGFYLCQSNYSWNTMGPRQTEGHTTIATNNNNNSNNNKLHSPMPNIMVWEIVHNFFEEKLRHREVK